MRARIRTRAADGLDRRPACIDRQERQIAGVADIERARIDRFENGRRGREFRPFDLVRQVFCEPRYFEQRTVAAFLVADAQRDDIGGNRRRLEREDESSSHKASGDVTDERGRTC